MVGLQGAARNYPAVWNFSEVLNTSDADSRDALVKGPQPTSVTVLVPIHKIKIKTYYKNVSLTRYNWCKCLLFHLESSLFQGGQSVPIPPVTLQITQKSCAAIQRDLDMLEWCTNSKIMKCQVLHLGRTTPSTSTHWGPPSWKAACQRRTWGPGGAHRRFPLNI